VAAMWLLLYGLNAYWLTAVHKPKLSLRKHLVFSRLNPAREYQTVQAATTSLPSSGAIAVNNFDNFERFRLDKPLTNGFSSYVLAVDPPEHHAIALEDLPIVTIQLQIFNERYVSRKQFSAKLFKNIKIMAFGLNISIASIGQDLKLELCRMQCRLCREITLPSLMLILFLP